MDQRALFLYQAKMFVENAEKRLTTMAPEVRAAGPKPIMGK